MARHLMTHGRAVQAKQQVKHPNPAKLAKLEKRSHPPNEIIAVLPADGFMRIDHIIGNNDAKPPIVGVFPVSKLSWWRGIREGRFPKPVKLGPNSTGWKVEDIRELLSQIAGE
jgi:prophage regulatory protein